MIMSSDSVDAHCIRLSLVPGLSMHSPCADGGCSIGWSDCPWSQDYPCILPVQMEVAQLAGRTVPGPRTIHAFCLYRWKLLNWLVRLSLVPELSMHSACTDGGCSIGWSDCPWSQDYPCILPRPVQMEVAQLAGRTMPGPRTIHAFSLNRWKLLN